MQLSSVAKASGRQVPRHREAGRRKHGTTMTRRTPRKGRLRPGKLQLIQSAAVSTCCQFWFTEKAPVQWPHLPPKLLGWRGHNGCERHDTFNLEENALHDIRHYRETAGTIPNVRWRLVTVIVEISQHASCLDKLIVGRRCAGPPKRNRFIWYSSLTDTRAVLLRLFRLSNKVSTLYSAMARWKDAAIFWMRVIVVQMLDGSFSAPATSHLSLREIRNLYLG